MPVWFSFASLIHWTFERRLLRPQEKTFSSEFKSLNVGYKGSLKFGFVFCKYWFVPQQAKVLGDYKWKLQSCRTVSQTKSIGSLDYHWIYLWNNQQASNIKPINPRCCDKYYSPTAFVNETEWNMFMMKSFPSTELTKHFISPSPFYWGHSWNISGSSMGFQSWKEMLNSVDMQWQVWHLIFQK